ncbi:hypothetical protein HYPSUDRAFT_203182 [Hypholoma sublateritium FD-334 SS-4]|uniref:Uncharacterized protein n=1 Tax=Hypholoma sublateritium (strain FD-334 SS-4) TaxID=945553 RepID=A0A0D2NR34_HYPSF|nr:hypothetical protein HYPSUDRAFT_203182 [Hypholoma sublateritium FD-334 SS-4]
MRQSAPPAPGAEPKISAAKGAKHQAEALRHAEHAVRWELAQPRAVRLQSTRVSPQDVRAETQARAARRVYGSAGVVCTEAHGNGASPADASRREREEEEASRRSHPEAPSPRPRPREIASCAVYARVLRTPRAGPRPAAQRAPWIDGRACVDATYIYALDAASRRARGAACASSCLVRRSLAAGRGEGGGEAPRRAGAGPAWERGRFSSARISPACGVSVCAGHARARRGCRCEPGCFALATSTRWACASRPRRCPLSAVCYVSIAIAAQRCHVVSRSDGVRACTWGGGAHPRPGPLCLALMIGGSALGTRCAHARGYPRGSATGASRRGHVPPRTAFPGATVCFLSRTPRNPFKPTADI